MQNLPATTSKVKQYDYGTVHFIKAMKLITAKGTSAGGMQSLSRGPGGLVRGRAVRHMYDFATQYLRYRKEQLDQSRSSVRLELTSHAPSVEAPATRSARRRPPESDLAAGRPRGGLSHPQSWRGWSVEKEFGRSGSG